MYIRFYPMPRADSRFWLVNNREIWSRIARLTSSAWDIKTKERHWWRQNGDSDRRPLSLPQRYDLVTLCLYDDLGQINVIAGILKPWKRFRMSKILFEHGINSLPLVCFRGYGNLSTRSIAIPRAKAARGIAMLRNSISWFRCNRIRFQEPLLMTIKQLLDSRPPILSMSHFRGDISATLIFNMLSNFILYLLATLSMTSTFDEIINNNHDWMKYNLT